MKVIDFSVQTTAYQQLVCITDQVTSIVTQSGFRNGFLTIQSRHTTAGITVNEHLECLEDDINTTLGRLVPEDLPYAHARMLPAYGSTAGNPTGHIKAHLTGNHCHFPVIDGAVVRGEAQDIFLAEFDGPSIRTIMVIMTD